MSIRKLSNISLAKYREFLTKTGCKCDNKLFGELIKTFNSSQI